MSESTQEWILKRRHEDLGVTVRMCSGPLHKVLHRVPDVQRHWTWLDTDAPWRRSNDSPREAAYCRRFFDPDDPDRGNKRRNRALYSTRGP